MLSVRRDTIDRIARCTYFVGIKGSQLPQPVPGQVKLARFSHDPNEVDLSCAITMQACEQLVLLPVVQRVAPIRAIFDRLIIAASLGQLHRERQYGQYPDTISY
ncbi:hypothetical protein JDV02_003113 [Purpureocillium takamizusanense]|uniref:Uncharacterized protein n=1 Tax=Purpureocillium takamizusanense TaxID=2060973 RepID=A0A9Q8V9C2_9HYPO|nr:uncharacterized protein JDV02_003113 [Purpureocillium takamizusanense]UNI16699.1 hypothetical protein JDV02_003113 [Purpureocillium takamizusanense]